MEEYFFNFFGQFLLFLFALPWLALGWFYIAGGAREGLVENTRRNSRFYVGK